MKSVLNYINYISKKEKMLIKHVGKENNAISVFWIICIHDLNNNCNLSLDAVKHIKLNRVDLILTNKL